MIKTRFAPSPTGELHIGSARTALFGYLLAKHDNGQFFLRIEDTDQNRLVEGSDQRIVESLRWLGIIPDNLSNIMYQSKRLDVYKDVVLGLLNKNNAYICDCSKERLEELRNSQQKKGLPTGYDRHCRGVQSSKLKVQSKEDLESILKTGAVVRMKMPERGKIVINDLIRGRVEFDAALSDDQIIMKSDGFPTYHLAHVVDDQESGITHVARAEEWLPSTPKHVVLHQLLGWKLPEYAHFSMILPPDKKGKLSKRHGAVSVMDFKREGYLPEALVNFIAFMGWNPKTERETFSMSELISEFKIENLNKNPAIFNKEKLNDINERYLREKFQNTEAKKLKTVLKDYGIEELTQGEIDLLSRGGYVTLLEMGHEISALRAISEYPTNLLVFKKSNRENALKGLLAAQTTLNGLENGDWNHQGLQMELSLAVTRQDLTNGDLFWPVRVALSGKEKSPSPVELLIALGKEESLERIKKAIKKLK